MREEWRAHARARQSEYVGHSACARESEGSGARGREISGAAQNVVLAPNGARGAVRLQRLRAYQLVGLCDT